MLGRNVGELIIDMGGETRQIKYIIFRQPLRIRTIMLRAGFGWEIKYRRPFLAGPLLTLTPGRWGEGC